MKKQNKMTERLSIKEGLMFMAMSIMLILFGMAFAVLVIIVEYGGCFPI